MATVSKMEKHPEHFIKVRRFENGTGKKVEIYGERHIKGDDKQVISTAVFQFLKDKLLADPDAHLYLEQKPIDDIEAYPFSGNVLNDVSIKIARDEQLRNRFSFFDMRDEPRLYHPNHQFMTKRGLNPDDSLTPAEHDEARRIIWQKTLHHFTRFPDFEKVVEYNIDPSAKATGAIKAPLIDSRMLDIIVSQTNENPLFYVGFGHLDNVETALERDLGESKPDKFYLTGKGFMFKKSKPQSGLNSKGVLFEVKPKKQILIHHQTRGGKLKVDDLRRLLNGAYTGKEQIGDYSLDKGISSKTSKVYVNNKTQKAVVAHRGTSGLSDWFNNLAYGIGGKTLYEMTPRYKEAKKVQDQAMKKYGASNISTIGHSQGGLQAELLGAPTHEIITLNKATRPFSNTKALNEYDVRTQNDIVSALNPAQETSSRDITIPSKSRNPIEEHSTDTLKRLNPDMEIGKGLNLKEYSKGVNLKEYSKGVKFNSFFSRGTRGGGLPNLFPTSLMNNFKTLSTYLPPEIQGGLSDLTGGLNDISDRVKSAMFSTMAEALF